MKTHKLFEKIASIALIGGILAVASCNEEDRLTIADTQDITEEAVTDSYFQDMDDMAGVAMSSPSDEEYSGGRKATTITISDERFGCQGVLVSIEPDATSSLDIPKGILTVDFGILGCTVNGNVRTGKLIFEYNGRRFVDGSTVKTTTNNYTINGVKLEGTRLLKNVTGSTSEAPKFNAILENGKATFADGTVAERESDITWQWVRTANPSGDYLQIDQASTASGKTRGARTYTVSLTEALKYKRFCGIAVEGIKKYVIDGSKEITIDYGDGTCDKSVIITVNGVTRNLTVD
jgi:hypothetical protein